MSDGKPASLFLTLLQPVIGRYVRFLGLWLWLADVAPRLRPYRGGAGAASWRASGALRLFLGASGNAREAGTGARTRPRRFLPRHRLPGRGGEARIGHRLSAGTGTRHRRLPRG